MDGVRLLELCFGENPIVTEGTTPRAAWKKVLIGAIAPVVFFALAELGFLLAGLPSTGIYEGDRYTDWRLKGNLDEEVLHESEDRLFRIRTSESGFRGGAEEGSVDVVALGCSTTFGWGVEEREAWPEVLEDQTGLSVLNGGVPGHSTHQGRSVAMELLDLNPRLLVLGWLVRDAQRSSQADKMARAPRGLRNTRVVRWLSRSRTAQRGQTAGGERRVSPEDFGANLQAVIDAAKERGIPVLLLQFPMQQVEPDYQRALQNLGVPVVAPKLAEDAFFPTDPIHLTAGGHRQLAEALAPSVLEALSDSGLSGVDG